MSSIDAITEEANERQTRNDAREEDRLSTPPDRATAVACSISIRTSPLRTRSARPRCSDYGPYRQFIFTDKNYMFCAQCDIWDSETPEGRERNNGNSRRFGCTARHTSFAFPTDVIKRNCRLEAMNAKPPSDNEDDNTDDDKSLDKNVSVSSDTLDILQGDFLSS